MFNPEKVREGYEVTVGMLILELSKEDPNLPVTICGDPHVIIHVGEDETDFGVCLDNDYLTDSYDEDFDTESIRPIEPVVFDQVTKF